MKWFVLTIWFLMSVIAGAAIYLAVAPNPVIQAVTEAITGTNAFDRCIKAQRCRKVPQSPAQPGHFHMAPAGLDRA